MRVVSASIPNAAGGQSAAVGTLVNGAPWTIVIYLNQDPDVPGAAPLTFLSPTANIQLAFRPGQHRLVARPTGAAPGTLPKVTWSRQIEDRPTRTRVQAPIQRGGLPLTQPSPTDGGHPCLGQHHATRLTPRRWACGDTAKRLGARSRRRARLHEIIFEADTAAGRAFDIGLLVSILVSVLAVMLESVTVIRREYGGVLRAVEGAITVVFTGEYVLRLVAVDRP